jgi:hypothetical protein
MERRLQWERPMAPQSSQGETAVLLVVEGAAAAPLWPEHLGDAPSAGWAMLEQEEWEPVAPFLSRLTDALDRDAASAAPTRQVVLIAGVSLERATLAARHLTSLAILQYLSQVGGGTLLLSHGHSQTDAACEELVELARELDEEWSESGVVVATRFESDVADELRKAG